MSTTASTSKWDVVLLAYPFTDLAATKVRPAIVISPDSSSAGQDAVFMAITSKAGHGPFTVLIRNNHPEFGATGLLTDSTVLVDKLFTLKKTLVRRPLGKLGATLQSDVEKQLRVFFELS